MAKFNITQWTDFVRELAGADAQEEMLQSLEGNQRKDLKVVELLQQVAAVGKLDHALDIPLHAVRGAKAIGCLGRPELAQVEAPGVLRFLPFELTFDSLLQPAAVGTRNLHASDRQFVFDADHFTIEVRLEQETDPASTVLVGELLKKQQAAPEPMSHVPVLVKSGTRIVAQSSTGSFGEFQAEGLPAENLSLLLMVGEHECIQLPLQTS